MHLGSEHKHCSCIKLCCAKLCIVELYVQSCSQVSIRTFWMIRLLLPARTGTACCWRTNHGTHDEGLISHIICHVQMNVPKSYAYANTYSCSAADRICMHARVQRCVAVQLIEDQPCQVPMTDALHFAQQFDASHKLPGESTSQSVAQAGPQAAWPLQSNSCKQPAGQDVRGKRQSADQVRRQQKLKQKEKKKKRKRRK